MGLEIPHNPPSLQVHEINDEPRILDIDLAVKLGFSLPREIRRLIERNRLELERYGNWATVAQFTGKPGFSTPRNIRKLIERNRLELERYGNCVTVTQITGKLGYVRPTDIRELIERNAAELATYGIIRTARINTGKPGFGQILNVRNLIRNNRVELERYGVIFTVKRTSGPKGGRPSTDFYLNEEQALLICMFADTVNAMEARQEIIQVFTTTIGDIKVSLRCFVKDGTVWFVAKDVTVSLGYVSGRQSLADHVPDAHKAAVSIPDGSQRRTLSAITEGGLYRLIGASKTELGDLFREWVYDTVLPSIRKHGGYILGQEKPEMSEQEPLLQDGR